MGFAASDVNLYRFVGNNPTNDTDPSGLFGGLTVAGASLQAAHDRLSLIKPDDLQWHHFQTLKKRPEGAIPGQRAQTTARLEIRPAKVTVDKVWEEPSACPYYCAKVTVNAIDIRVRFLSSQSWFLDDPLAPALSDAQKQLLLKHERFHLQLGILFAKTLTKRWNEHPDLGKKGVTATGCGSTKEAAIAAAKDEAQQILKSHLDKMDKEHNRLQREYDAIAHVPIKPGSLERTINANSQALAEERISSPAFLGSRVGDVIKAIKGSDTTCRHVFCWWSV